MQDVTKLINQVVVASQEILKDLRNTPEDQWTDDDHGAFHLAGALLTLHREVNLNEPQIKQLLLASANACIQSTRRYETVPKNKLSDFDKSLMLMCNVYLHLFKKAIDQGKLKYNQSKSH